MTERRSSSGIAALSFTASAALLALALTPAAASADTNVGGDIELTAPGDRIVEERRIDASGVDFTSASDLRKLDSRILRAISAVCDEPGLGRNTIAEGRCRDQARKSSNAQVAALRSQAIALAAAGRTAPAPRDIVVAAR
jgi:UrcA family protein